MSIDIKKAVTNIFNSKWQVKFIILALLSLPGALIGSFKSLSQSVGLLGAFLISIISLLLSALASGYMYKYLHDLMQTPENALPDWKAVKEFFLIGIKPIGAAILFYIFMAIFVLLSAAVFPKSARLAVLAIIMLVIALIFIVFLYGIILSYCEDFKFLSIFNLKKAASYFSWQYFLIILISILLSLGCGVLFWVFEFVKLGAIVSTVAGTFIGLIIYNLLAQLYHDKKAKTETL